MGTARTDARGAYGLRLDGVDDALDLLVPAAADWPEVRLGWRLGDETDDRHEINSSSASLRLLTGGSLHLERVEGTAEFVVPRPLGPEELVHPYLVPVAAVMAFWHRRDCVHAGGFVGGDSGVWGVVGDRESGKSTTLARLAADGGAVVADDLLVLDDGAVYAGPRAIDLREESARRLAVGASIGVAGARERWRVRLGPLPDGLRLRGWFHLAWGGSLEAVPVRGGDRIARLLAQRPGGLPSLAPAAMLELASLPAWEIRRPRSWESLDETVDCLRELAGG